LILIVPRGTDAQGDSSFNIVTVQLSDTVDPASAFRNYGFSSMSDGDLGSSFGGAVAVDVNGTQHIVWLNAGQNLPPSFTGEVSADYGTIDVLNGGNAGTVVGLVGKAVLVFENGALVAQKDSEGAEITDFDAFVRNQIASQPEFPELKSILETVWQAAFSRDTMVYALSNSEKSRVFSRSGNDQEQDGIAVRQAILLQEALRQRGTSAGWTPPQY
jgi:hypothetical protein